MKHTNFYETIKEASMRLDNTVVLYDGFPYYVLCVCDHNPDGIFRVYLDPLQPDGPITINDDMTSGQYPPYTWQQPPGGETRGAKMDEWLAANPKTRIIRKMANSPLFGKFRPFPLGMCNVNGQVYYIERTPNRSTHQGLTDTMMVQTKLVLDPNDLAGKSSRHGALHSTSPYLYHCIRGNYPDIKECIAQLEDPDVMNSSVAFNRVMALVRGPLNTLFLAYKGDIVGMLPYNNLDCLRLSKKYNFVREIISEVCPVKEFKIV